MRFFFICITFFCTPLAQAQYNSEASYFFNDDIDTLLCQLQKNKFRTFNIVIKNRDSREKKEWYNYLRLNDSILVVRTKEYTSYCYFDFQSRRYQPLDDQFCKYFYPLNTSFERKDSAGYQVLSYKNSQFDFYSRTVKDSGGIEIYRDKNANEVMEREIKYKGDTTIYKNNKVLHTGQRVLINCDTAIIKSITSKERRIEYLDYYSQTKSANTTDYFSHKMHSEKVYFYSPSNMVSKIVYKSKDSILGKGKAQMKIYYE